MGWHSLLAVRKVHSRCDTFRNIDMSDTETMTEHPLSIVPLEPSDWSTVRAIYLEGIATGNATFEKAAPEWADWDRSHLRQCRLAAHCNDEIVGWAALTPVSGRCVYAGVAEVSVYVATRVCRQGVGLALLSALVAASERARASGRYRVASSRRTSGVSRSAAKPDSVLSERGSGSDVWTAVGVT
jgi:L-amino acid N-acyltransferase YncA